MRLGKNDHVRDVYFLEDMEEKKIEFKPSSKYFMQTAFARMSLKNMHSKLTFFYQLIGTMHKKKVNFTSLAFLRCLSQALDN